MGDKLVIYDYKINSESCFFINIKSQLKLTWFIGLLEKISFKEIILCTEEIDRTRKFIEEKLGAMPNIQIVSSISIFPDTLVLRANYVYDKSKLIKLIKKGIVDLSSAVLWEIKDKHDIRDAEAVLERIEKYPIARHINLKLAKRLANSLATTSVQPNQLTFISLIVGILACIGFASNSYGLLVAGAFLIQLHSILDFADGQLARLKGISTRLGAFLDGIVNKIVESFCYAGLAYGLFIKYNNEFFLIIGLLVILGHFMIEYINFLKMRYLKGDFSPAYQIENKKLPFKVLKKIYWFLEAWDVRLYIISLFAVLNRVEIAIIYFVVDFNTRWIFNVIKIILRRGKNL